MHFSKVFFILVIKTKTKINATLVRQLKTASKPLKNSS